MALPAINASVPGRTILRPPGGAIVGLMMSIDANIGVWQAPAGTPRGLLTGAVDLERSLTEADMSTLNNNQINALDVIAGEGIAVWGARTLKKSGKDMYIPVRRSLIEIGANLVRLTKFAVFENNNPRLWERISAVCGRYLAEFWQAGGLSGATSNEAYFVKCDDSVNTPQSIAAGQVNIEVGVALQTPAEFIVITIGQYEGGSSVTTS